MVRVPAAPRLVVAVGGSGLHRRLLLLLLLVEQRGSSCVRAGRGGRQRGRAGALPGHGGGGEVVQQARLVVAALADDVVDAGGRLHALGQALAHHPAARHVPVHVRARVSGCRQRLVPGLQMSAGRSSPVAVHGQAQRGAVHQRAQALEGGLQLGQLVRLRRPHVGPAAQAHRQAGVISGAGGGGVAIVQSTC